MNHLFLDKDLSLIAKEKGFDEPCFGTYRKYSCSGSYFEYDIDFHTKVQLDHKMCPKNSEYVNDWYSAPLYQQIVDWLKEEHDIDLSILGKLPYVFEYSGEEGELKWHYEYRIIQNKDGQKCEVIEPKEWFNEKKDCFDKAIKEAFKLIP